MSYREKLELAAEKTIALGGTRADGTKNPTQIEGFYLGHREVPSDFGVAKLHIFKTKDGNVGVWGKSHLNALLTDDLRGMQCLVTFEGMRAPAKKGRNPSYSYKLKFDPDRRVDVSGISELDETQEDELLNESEIDSLVHDTSLEEEEAEYQPPTPPARAAVTPTTDRQAKFKAMLNSKKARS